MQNYIGQQIDRYRIIERLGMGGMAVVYKAYDVRLEREVALKLIRTEEIPASQHERLIKRFEREAKAQARFNHRHIVPVHDYGVVDGSPYLVMAYVEGGTMKDRIGGPVDYQQAVAWLLPIADALAYAHQRGIVHRDVKPTNILFDEAWQPLLTDFGIAKILETEEATLTGTGLGVGTPEYMAPEQWQGKAEAATDQYALGVVLYELLTGQKPYTAETPAAIAIQQATEPLKPPSEKVTGIPEALEKVLYKVLAKDPADRYADMGVFGKALSGLKLTEQPTPAPERVETRKTTETPSVSDVQPRVKSEGPTVDELEALRISSNWSDAQSPGKKVDKKKKTRGWLWIAGGGAIGLMVLILLTLVIVLFWPKGEDFSIFASVGSNQPTLTRTNDIQATQAVENSATEKAALTATQVYERTETYYTQIQQTAASAFGQFSFGLEGYNEDCEVVEISDSVSQKNVFMEEGIYLASAFDETLLGEVVTVLAYNSREEEIFNRNWELTVDDEGCFWWPFYFDPQSEPGTYHVALKLHDVIIYEKSFEITYFDISTIERPLYPAFESFSFGRYGVDSDCNVNEPVKSVPIEEISEDEWFYFASAYAMEDIGTTFSWKVLDELGNQKYDSDQEFEDIYDMCFWQGFSMEDDPPGDYILLIEMDNGHSFIIDFSLTDEP